MIDKVIRLEFWECPVCGYRVDDELYKQAKYDYRCPACWQANISEFHFRSIERREEVTA